MMTIYILNPHSIITLGISILLEEICPKCTISKGNSVYDLLSWISKNPATDCYILDANIPDYSCMDTVGIIRQRTPDSRIVVFSLGNDPMEAASYYAKGVTAFIRKGSSDYQIKQELTQVLNDSIFRKIRTNPTKKTG